MQTARVQAESRAHEYAVTGVPLEATKSIARPEERATDVAFCVSRSAMSCSLAIRLGLPGPDSRTAGERVTRYQK